MFKRLLCSTGAAATMVALASLFLATGCGESGPEVRAPENPQPLPEPKIETRDQGTPSGLSLE